MKTKLFSAVAVAALVAPVALTLGSASADAVTPATSTAKFAVTTTTDPTDPTDPTGKLELTKVPSFDFGTVKSSEIYAGITDKVATGDDTASISDLRSGATDDWTLTASMTQFKGAKANIDGSILLAGTKAGLPTASDAAGTLLTDGTAATLATKTDGSHGTTDYTFAGADNKLTTTAAPSAVLTDGEALTSTITWTLSSTQPVA